jgi:hypothetical protein
MSLHTKTELQAEFKIISEVPTNATHNIIVNEGQVEFISYSQASDNEFEVDIDLLLKLNNKTNLLSSNTKVRVIDYALGKEKNYAEIQFIENPLRTNGELIEKIGRFFIKQKDLVVISGNKDFDRVLENNYLEAFNSFSGSLSVQQPPNLGIVEWEQNFISDPNQQINWVYKDSFVDRPVTNKQGEVFYSKRLAGYCVSVLVNAENYNSIKDEDKEKIKNDGLRIILNYLNAAQKDEKLNQLKNKIYYDLARIVDINTEQEYENQKIKFLICVKHRHIAPYINLDLEEEAIGNVLSAIGAAFKKFPNEEEAIKNIFGVGGSSALTDIIVDSFATPEQKDLFKKIQEPKLREIIDLLSSTKKGKDAVEKYNELLKLYNDYKTNHPILEGIGQRILSDIALNIRSGIGNNFDLSIDTTTPFFVINFKDYEGTKSFIDSFASSSQALQDGSFKKYLEEHEIIPSLNLGSLGTSCQKLFESAYQYALNKIVIKESISESEAAERIDDLAVYLNADVSNPDKFSEGLLSDIPDYFKAVSVQVRYDNQEKSILVGSSKENDFANITNIKDRTVLFLYYSMNYIMQTYFPIESGQRTNKVGLDKEHNIENFIARTIFPYRRIIYKPKDPNKASAAECVSNIYQSFADDLATQTLSFRKSLYSSYKSFDKNIQASKAGFPKILKDLDEQAGDIDEFLFSLLSNINITALLATLVECLRKKGVPIELILQIIEVLKKILAGNWSNLLCLVPPIKLPKLPTLDLSFDIPVVDLMGTVYEGILKALKDLFNNLIVESFKLLLDQLLDCEGAFEGTDFIDGLFNTNINSRPGSQKNLDGSQTNAIAQPAFAGANSIMTETEETTRFSYVNNSSFISLLIPEFAMPASKSKDLVKEMQSLIERLSKNLSTPDYLNLLTGSPSPDVEIFIKDTVKIDPLYLTLFESGVLSNRQGIINVFTRLASLVDQEVLTTVREATNQIITDANALCVDNAVESADEALFLAKKFGQEKVAAIKRKITEKQINTISVMERFLNPNGFQDLIPPIKCRINPDGSITPGLLPSEPHASEIYLVNKMLKTNFDVLKDTFNNELNTAKLSALSTITVKNVHPIKRLKKMYPDAINEDGDRLTNRELLDQRGTYYTNAVSLNKDIEDLFKGNKIKKTVNPVNGIETVEAELIFPKPDIGSTVSILDQLGPQLRELDDEEQRKITEIRSKLEQVSQKINSATTNLKNKLKFVDGEPVASDPSKTSYTLELEHSKLSPSNKITIRNEEQFPESLQKIFESLKDVNGPRNFNYFQNKKLFTKLLYKNNVLINAEKRKSASLPAGLPPSFDTETGRQEIYNIYENIYDSFEQNNKDAIISSILQSPLFKVNPENGKPFILNLPLESRQTDYCLAQGKPDQHLLRLEDEKKKIIEYYKKNKCFDKSKPRDGSASDELNAIEKGTLFTYIDLHFRIYIYDYYTRAMSIFNRYGIKNTNTKLMNDFFYNIFINDKKFMKIKAVTKNNKFIFEYYKYLNKQETNSQEIAYRYLIQKNTDLVIDAFDKKFKKAAYISNNQVKKLYQTSQEINPLDNLLNSLDILRVVDADKDNDLEKNLKNELVKKFIVSDNNDIIKSLYANYYDKRKKALDKLEEIYFDKVFIPFKQERANSNFLTLNSQNETKVPIKIYQEILKILRDDISIVTTYTAPQSNPAGSSANNLFGSGPQNPLGNLSGGSYQETPVSTIETINGYKTQNRQEMIDNFLSGAKTRLDAISGYLNFDIYKVSVFQAYLDEIFTRSQNNSAQFQYQFLEFIDILLRDQKYSRLLQNINIGFYIIPSTMEKLNKAVDKLFNNFTKSDLRRVLEQEPNILEIDNIIRPETVSFDKDNLPGLSDEGANKLRILSNRVNTINISDFFIKIENNQKLQNFSDTKIGSRGYSSGLFVNNQGIFLNKPYEITRFSRPNLTLLNDPNLISLIQELEQSIKALKNICSKPNFTINEGVNKNILLQQKNTKSSNPKFFYYLANIYRPRANIDLSKIDPNNAMRFTLKKDPTSSSGDVVILTVFSKVKIDDKTYILDKNDKNNKDLIDIYETIFQPKKEFVFYTIAAMCQNSLMKDVDIIFNNSKRFILKNIKSIVNNNYDYINSEEENDSSSFQLSVYIKAALALPVVIVKGLAEAVDPNIAFTSKISLAIKVVKEFIKSLPAPPGVTPTPQAIADEIPDIPVPLLSLPLGFTFPFMFTPLTIIYLILCGFSIDDEENFKSNLRNLSNKDGSEVVEICEDE